jgi:hypothetical protein
VAEWCILSEGEFKDINCPSCGGTSFEAIYFYIRNNPVLLTLICLGNKAESCRKEIDVVPYDNEDSGQAHDVVLDIEYHEQEIEQ